MLSFKWLGHNQGFTIMQYDLGQQQQIKEVYAHPGTNLILGNKTIILVRVHLFNRNLNPCQLSSVKQICDWIHKQKEVKG